jgi:hypothetical protein
MGDTDFGNFEDFCRDGTLPVCNLLSRVSEGNGDELAFFGNQTGGWGGCELRGISLGGDRRLANLGTILLCGLAIAVSMLLLFRSEKKRAAVGRREMQVFLLSYIIISICEIFSVGGIPLDKTVRIAFTAIHIGMIIASAWVLLLNAVVGFQLVDDGTFLSLGFMIISAGALFIGTGYIALDTGLDWTGYWNDAYEPPYRHIALYVLYQLVPLIFIVAFFVLESVLVIRILGEIRPMIYLVAAALLFAIGQVFNYTISPYICDGTNGRIDGAMFETLFTLLSVVAVWIFWSSITEDDWPVAGGASYT